jgi:hypothetical protein
MDAESQMKNPDSPGGSALHVEKTAEVIPTVSPIPRSVWDPLLDVIANAGTALAADDLKAYRDAASSLRAAISSLPSPAPEALASDLSAIEASTQTIGSANDLAAARAEYLPLSEAAADLALALKKTQSGAGRSRFLPARCRGMRFPPHQPRRGGYNPAGADPESVVWTRNDRVWCETSAGGAAMIDGLISWSSETVFWFFAVSFCFWLWGFIRSKKPRSMPSPT